MMNSQSTEQQQDVKTIRSMRIDDLPLAHEAFMALSRDMNKAESAKKYIQYLHKVLFEIGSAVGFVVEVDGWPAGLAVVSLEEHQYETPRFYVLGELVYVRRKFRRSGVGELLVRTAFEFCQKQAQVEKIRVVLQLKNAEFNKLFIELGFQEYAAVYDWRGYEKA